MGLYSSPGGSRPGRRGRLRRRLRAELVEQAEVVEGEEGEEGPAVSSVARWDISPGSAPRPGEEGSSPRSLAVFNISQVGHNDVNIQSIVIGSVWYTGNLLICGIFHLISLIYKKKMNKTLS